MHLLDLPTEVLEEVIHQAVVARGIKRGLRLRLVHSKYSIFVLVINERINYRQVLLRDWLSKFSSLSDY